MTADMTTWDRKPSGEHVTFLRCPPVSMGQISNIVKIQAEAYCRNVNAFDSNAILDDEPDRMGRLKKSPVQTCHEGHQDMGLLGMLCYLGHGASCDLQCRKYAQDLQAGTHAKGETNTLYEHEHLLQSLECSHDPCIDLKGAQAGVGAPACIFPAFLSSSACLV